LYQAISVVIAVLSHSSYTFLPGLYTCLPLWEPPPSASCGTP